MFDWLDRLADCTELLAVLTATVSGGARAPTRDARFTEIRVVERALTGCRAAALYETAGTV